MDKSCQSSADSTTTTATASSSSGNFTSGNLRQLNKLSHKISKSTLKKPTFDSSQTDHQSHNPDHNQPQPAVQAQAQQQNLQHQPPVYNINKNEFRDVVQMLTGLTGSSAHERISTPPPIHQPKQPSSRLQRIRPPPLPQIGNRPPPLLNTAIPRPLPPTFNAASEAPSNPINPASVTNFSEFVRPLPPLSPLPPFPSVHAESPVSAYMRYLQNSVSNMDGNAKQFSGFSPLAPLVSPRRNNLAPQQPQPDHQSQVTPMQQGVIPSQTSANVPAQPQFQIPSSPAPFGCLNSPRSPFPLLSPSLLFSPSSSQLGFSQLPLSPTVPVPSPRWRGL